MMNQELEERRIGRIQQAIDRDIEGKARRVLTSAAVASPLKPSLIGRLLIKIARAEEGSEIYAVFASLESREKPYADSIVRLEEEIARLRDGIGYERNPTYRQTGGIIITDELFNDPDTGMRIAKEDCGPNRVQIFSPNLVFHSKYGHVESYIPGQWEKRLEELCLTSNMVETLDRHKKHLEERLECYREASTRKAFGL